MTSKRQATELSFRFPYETNIISDSHTLKLLIKVSLSRGISIQQDSCFFFLAFIAY